MRNSKRFLTTLIAVLALVAVLCVSASAATAKFSDVNAKDEQLTKAVSLLSYLEVAKGTSETTFGTSENVTRQQMAAFIYRLVKQGKSVEGGENTTTFEDLTDSTYFAYVSWANSLGIIKGTSATTFDPTGSITLQDAYTMILRALGYEKEGALEYPYDFIDIAESDGVELDDGLDSKITYDKALTRGDVAILLYNAFFAETAYTETVSEERRYQNGVNAGEAVVIEREVNPTVAEYYYDAIQGEFTVMATPHFSFNLNETSSTYKPLVDSFDVDTLEFVTSNPGLTIIGQKTVDNFYIEFDELSIPGVADDYIMAGFDIYYTITEDGKLDKILYADGAVSKKTASDAELGKVDPKKKSDYFRNSNGTPNTSYPLLDGSLSVAGQTVYFFDAPYSYLKPHYGNNITSSQMYDLRNAKNIKFLEYKIIDFDAGTFGYYINTSKVANTPVDLALALNQVYTKGVFEIDIYDVDNDGIYEYMRYKPATLGRATVEEGRDFMDEHTVNEPVYVTNTDTNSLAHPTIPTIYVNNAYLYGKAFNEDEFIAAYLNPAANEIVVMGIAERTQGTFADLNKSTCTIKVNGKSFRLPYVYLFFNQYDVDGYNDSEGNYLIGTGSAQTGSFPKLKSEECLGKDFVIYSFNKHYNNVVFYEPLDTTGANYSPDKILIPLPDASGNIFTTQVYNAAKFRQDQYMRVWLNGEVKVVPVETTEDVYPAVPNSANGFDFGGVTVTGSDSKTYRAYYNKLCSYEIDADGVYHIQSLLHAQDKNGRYIGINNDPRTLAKVDNTDLYGRDLEHETAVQIKHVTGDRYRLVDAATDLSLLGDETIQYIESFVMTPETKIIIRNYKSAEDEYEFLTYDNKSFGTTSANSFLTNVQYILQGDARSSVKADMVALYADAVDFEFEVKTSKSDWRIIKNTYVSTDSEGMYRNYYDVYNPFTGEIEENVAGSKAFSKATSLNLHAPFANAFGKFAKLNVLGEIDEAQTSLDTLNFVTNDNLAFIEEHSVTNNAIEIIPVAVADSSSSAANNYGYAYNATKGGYFFEVDENTAVTVLTVEEIGDFKQGVIAPATLADLVKPKNDMLAYNDKQLKPGNTTYFTKYAENLKVYVYCEDTVVGPNDLPHADFILVVVHPDEIAAYLHQ